MQHRSSHNHVYRRLLFCCCFLSCFCWRRRSFICCLRVAPSGRWLNGRCSLHNGGLAVSCTCNGGWSQLSSAFSNVNSHDSTAASLLLVDGSSGSSAINAPLNSPWPELSGPSIIRMASTNTLCHSGLSASLMFTGGVFLLSMLSSRVPTSQRIIRP